MVEKMLALIKKYWFLIILTLAAITLLFIWIQVRIVPKEGVAIPTPFPALPKIVFPDIGEKLRLNKEKIQIKPQVVVDASITPLYQTKNITLTTDQASLIAVRLGFPKNPSLINKGVSGEKMVWLKDASTLIIQLSPIEIKLTTEEFFSPPPINGEFRTPQEYVDYLKSLISSLLPEQNGIDYILDSVFEKRDGKTKEIRLLPKVKDKKVLDISTLSLVTVEFQKDQKLFSFYFNAGFTSPVSTDSYPTKTKKEIEKAILSEGRVMLVGEPSESPRELIYSAININSTKEALLFVPDKPYLLYPIYILTGTALTQEGEIPIVIYIPAVKSEYVSFAP